MKVLVIGSGGREHTLVWKIAQPEKVDGIFAAPGNAGMAELAECVSIDVDDHDGLLEFARDKQIDLTVVGPEAPLVAGIVDLFAENGQMIFGFDSRGAQLEGSKVFAKQFMERHKIPTGRFRIAETPEEAMNIINTGVFPYPLVIKAEGLAAGKGVIVCKKQENALQAIETIMVEKKFGSAGNVVVIEEFLRGQEVSFIVISDGVKIVPKKK